MLRIFLRCMPLLFLAAPAYAMPESFAPMVEETQEAVVNISTTQKVKAQAGLMPFDFKELQNDPRFAPFKDFFHQFGQPPAEQGEAGPESEVTSLGSGFVIDKEGYIVTNSHVIADAEEVTVTFADNTKLPAKIIGRDSKTDLALLKVKSKTPLKFVNFGDSDALKVGDWVVAVGNPFGLGGTVTAGIVSARGRNINIGPFDDFIQTDAAINRGNSGGPLFNTKGEVVGISTAIFSPTGGSVGIGFAAPSALAKPIIQQLREHGKASRAWIGVKIQVVSDEIANSLGLGAPRGALVVKVDEEGPAAGSGIEAGDVVVRFDGHDIKEMHNLPRLVAGSPIGKRAEVVVWRNGKEIPYQVTLGKLPDDPNMKLAPTEPPSKKEMGRKETLLGMVLSPLNRELRKQYRIAKDVSGLLVRDLVPGSVAMRRGIQPGDVILDIGQKPTESIASLKQALADAQKEGRDFALLRIQRGENSQFITLPTKQKR
jgi:serine protease Do